MKSLLTSMRIYQSWNRILLLGHTLLFFALLIITKPFLPYQTGWFTNFFSYVAIVFVSVYISFSLMAIHILFEWISHRRWVAATVSILISYPIIMYLIIDYNILIIYHMHFEWSFIKLLFIKGLGYYNITGITQWFMLGAFIGVLIVYILIYFLLTLIHKKIPKFMRICWRSLIILGISTFILTNYISLYSIMVGPLKYYANGRFIKGYWSIPLYGYLEKHPSISHVMGLTMKPNHLSLQDRQLDKKDFYYPKHPLQYHTSQTKKYNIVFIMVDTLAYRFYHKTMTYTKELAKHSYDFTENYADATYTLPSVFTIFYSLPANYMNQIKNHPSLSPLLWDALKKQQYNYTSQIYFLSDITQFTKDRVFPSIKVKTFENQIPWKRDLSTTQSIIKFLHQRISKKTPFFIFTNFTAVHASSYPTHQEVSGFKPKYSPCVSNVMDYSYAVREQIYNCHYNAAIFDDLMIRRIITTLKQQHLFNNTVIIITADHGEEIFDQNKTIFGHGIFFNRFQDHVPLIVHFPDQKGQKISYKTSNYDIIPTLMKNVLHVKNPISDYSIGRNLKDIHKSWIMLPIALPGKYGEIQGNVVQVFDTKYYFWQKYSWQTGHSLSGNKNLSLTQYHRLLNRLNTFSKAP